MLLIRSILVLLFLSTTFYSPPVLAQEVLREGGSEPVTNETANKYFDDCMKDKLTVRSEKGRAAFCACRAANLKQFITQKEYEMLYVENKEGDAAFLKYLTYVYGGCLKFPVEETVFRDCLTHDSKAKIYEAEPYCYCKTNRVVSFTNIYGPDVVHLRTHQLPRFNDPMITYLNSPEFRDELKKAGRACAISFSEEEQSFGKYDIILPSDLQ